MEFKYLLLSVILTFFTTPHFTYTSAVWTSGHPYSAVSPNIIPRPIQWVRQQDPSYFPCTSEGFFPHPTVCTLFYRCVRLSYLAEDYYLSYIFECPPGTAFEGTYDVCIPIDDTGCASQIPSVPEKSSPSKHQGLIYPAFF